MNSSEAQQEAVRRFGPLGAVLQFFQGAESPFRVGTALNHSATFTFHCFGRGDSWEAAFAEAECNRPEPFHTPRRATR